MSTLREKRKKERRALRRRKTADWTVVLILCAIAVCCGGYLIYHHWSVKQRELEYEKLRQEETLSAATETVIAEPETEESTEETVIYCDPVYDFGQLHEQNEDIYAWIIVPGTQVDYPLLQSETDNYYLDYNLDHSKGYPGCIYTNQCNRKDFSDYNTVLYGHNMKNLSMFGSLKKYKTEDFYKDHQFFTIYTSECAYRYQIFAYYDVPETDEVYTVGFAPDDTFQKFIDKMKQKSYDDTGVNVTKDDHIMTLSTCSTTGKRFVVHAVRIGEHALEK